MYTAKDIEDELVSILQPHRKRNYLDKINHIEYNNINNNGFLTAAADYMEKFPYTFTEKTKSDRHKRLHTVVVTLSDQTYKKLRNYTTIKETGTINVAGRNVIEKYLKLWEE